MNMSNNFNYLEELVRKIKSSFKSIKKDDYDSIIYEFLKVKNLEDLLIVSKKEVNLDNIFILLMKCELVYENHTIQEIIRLLKEAWAFVSYHKFEASEIIVSIEKMEFKFVSTSNSNKYFSGKFIISGELYQKSYKKYLDSLDNLNQ